MDAPYPVMNDIPMHVKLIYQNLEIKYGSLQPSTCFGIEYYHSTFFGGGVKRYSSNNTNFPMLKQFTNFNECACSSGDSTYGDINTPATIITPDNENTHTVNYTSSWCIYGILDH